MIASTKILPDKYIQVGEINLKTNLRLAFLLNIAAVFVALLSYYLLSIFTAFVRPDLVSTSETITAGVVAIIVGLVALLMAIHEFIHGFFFWVFTRSKPVFALRLFYAYAGAPDWHIPSRQFATVALSPLIIIDAVGLLLMLLVPESWVLMISFMVALNTGGAIGDLYVFSRLFKLSATSLVNDSGDVVTFYERQST